MMLISASFTDGTLQEKGRLVRKIKLQNITELIGGKKTTNGYFSPCNLATLLSPHLMVC